MEIPESFFDVSFNKAVAFGYKTEDVDEFVTKGPKDGAISEYMRSISQTGDYGQIFAKKIVFQPFRGNVVFF